MHVLDQSRTPMPILCQGSPREMGLAQGTALRQEIHTARQAISELESFRLRQPRWLPYLAYRWLSERKSLDLLAGCLERDYPAMSKGLAGIAEGARLPLRAIYLFNALEPLLSSIGGSTACPGACSAVSVRGSRSQTGEPILARNFDYIPLVQPYYAVRECRSPGTMRSLQFTMAPLIGAIDGINEHGLCITYNYAFTTDSPSSTPAPISLAIAEALERCRTVTEAANWITSRPHWGGGLLMLADATGDIASLELSSTRSHLRRPAAGEDVLFHTNAHTSAHLQEVQIPWEAIYSDRAPTPLRGRRVHLSSERRNERFTHLLAQTERFGPDELTALMADHGPTGMPGDFTPCNHGTYWYTTACMQLYPRSRRMRYSRSTACQAKYEELAL